MSTISLARGHLRLGAAVEKILVDATPLLVYNLREETIAGDWVISAADVTLLPTIFLRNRDKVTERIYGTLKRRLRRR